ncbi:MAG: DNA-directed RNA polymerase subunit A'' [Candidatus Aenigmarchaeota archaeon]|nr:DNA-directed RNA polymerase subunit A'' [Candidatus Aenigmarchaeota archaeon]
MSKKLQTEYELPKKILEDIDYVAKVKNLSPAKKKRLIEEVKKEYEKSIFEPGEALGIIAAQSISEPATQMTMRTYHFVGTAGIQVTLGLPRLIEIFDAKKEPSRVVMTLYLKKEFNTKEKSEKVAQKITEKKLRNYIETISLDLINKKIKLKLKKLKESEIKNIIEIVKKKLKNYKIKTLKDTISISLKSDSSIKDLQKLKKKLLDIHIAGIPTVKNVIVINQNNEWLIKASGFNFKEILKFDEIDKTRSYTNNIYEVMSVLGIEAARNVIIREIKDTLEQQGLDIDDRYIKLVTDMMTFTGEIKPIGRYGVAGMKSSVLVRAGFEETVKHLVKASVTNEVDDFSSLFDNVMVNQQIPAGTGMFELIARMNEK